MFNKTITDMKRISTLLSLLMLMALGTTSWAQSLKVAGVSVNLDATTTQTITGSNIEGKVTYSPSSKTLYLEDATINGDISGVNLGSSASTRYYIYLKGFNTLKTSDRGIRFDNSYVVLYGATGATLYINSLNSNSGYSCISTEGGHFEVWSIRLLMTGASKGFYGNPSSATLEFINSEVQISCDAGAIYGYKNVYFDDCKVTTSNVKFQSGKGYVDSAGGLVTNLNIWPLLCVGREPVRTASDSRTGTTYSWKWTKSTKTLEISGNISTTAYSGIANRGIEGLTIKVNDRCFIQSSNIGIGIEAKTKFAGNGTLWVTSSAGNAIVAHADVDFNMQTLQAYGKLHGFTDVRGGHTLTFYKYSSDCEYQFCGEQDGDICSSDLVFSNTDISNDNTYWNPSNGYVYCKNTIKTADPTVSGDYTTIVGRNQLAYYGFYVGETMVRANCTDYIKPKGLTSGTVKYDPSTSTLTLSNVALANTNGARGSGIYNWEHDGLKVQLVGDNTIISREALIRSEKSISLIGSGSLTGTATNGYGLFLGNDLTCTISGPQLDITARVALQDSMARSTVEVKGSTTQVSLKNHVPGVAINNLGNLKLAGDLAILEPSGGHFSSSLRTITTDGSTAYKGNVVIGQNVDYGMFIGETRVTAANAGDILGNGQFRYDASTKTLTVTNANLTNTSGALGGGIDNREIEGLTINFVGNSTITVRNSAVYSPKSFTMTGDGSLLGTATGGYGLYLAGDYITCTIDGPQLEFTGAYGLCDYTGTASLNVMGNSTNLTLYSKYSYNEAILNLGSLWLGSDIGILEPSAGYFSSSLKSITTDGTSAYKGKVVIGQVVDYGMYIAETRVTSTNAADILGDGQFSYDPSTKKLTVTNANLTNTSGDIGGGIVNYQIDGLTINLVGNSTITSRNCLIYTEKSLSIVGDGSLTGTATYNSGFVMYGRDLTCTIDGPRLEFSGSDNGFADYMGSATLNVMGNSTRLTFYSTNFDHEAICYLGNLSLGSGLAILEPEGGYFDYWLKIITTDGTSPYTGRVVIGKAANVKDGDVNLDGDVDIADAVCVLNAMAGEQVAGNPDVNHDGTIDIADFVSVLNIMAGQ